LSFTSVKITTSWKKVLEGCADIALVTGDCLELMKKMPESSINYIFTDPPYDYSVQYGGFALDDFLKLESWPFQKAVMLLAVEPWRAGFCSQCGMRLVADKPGRKFCGDKCSQSSRKGTKRAWWAKHGGNWRAKQKKSKRHTKAKSAR
jgi:hypothetical protein